jgi:regulator of protease activity HflC (stomatin/prohibitin superfamily)
MEEVHKALEVALERSKSDLAREQEQKLVVEAQEAVVDARTNAEQERRRAEGQRKLNHRRNEIELDRMSLEAEAESVVKRFEALTPRFTEALLALRDGETIKAIAEAWSMNRVVGGPSLADALSKVFANTPLSGIANRLTGSNNGESTSPKPALPRTSA